VNRRAVALVLPLATTGITVLLIIVIGNTLLQVRKMSHEMHLEHGLEALPSVAVALALSGAILIGCALAARGGTSEIDAHPHDAGHH